MKGENWAVEDGEEGGGGARSKKQKRLERERLSKEEWPDLGKGPKKNCKSVVFDHKGEITPLIEKFIGLEIGCVTPDLPNS